MNKEQYAPWEVQHGFASDRFLRNEASRASECELRPRTPSPAPRDPNLLSRTQWKLCDRKVVVPDGRAKRLVVTKNGHHLYLFDETQTVSL